MPSTCHPVPDRSRLVLLALLVAPVLALPVALAAAPEASKGDSAREVESRIVEVTVFGSGALVTRLADVDVDEGTQTVAFGKLPLSVDASSLRASVPGKSGLRILSVQARTRYGKGFRKEEAEALDKKVKALEARIRALSDREAVSRRTLDEISRVEVVPFASDPPRPPAIDPAPWARTLVRVRDVMTGAYSSLEGLAADQRSLGEEIETLRGEMARLSSYAVSGLGQAHVELRAPGKVRIPVKITYFVPAACWVPAYAVRVDPDAGKLTIEASARVAQTTGEDWEGARLLFSTALPTQAADLPKLTSWRVRERVQPPPPPAPPKPSEAMRDFAGARRKEMNAPAATAFAPPSVEPMPFVAPQGKVEALDKGQIAQLEEKAKAERYRAPAPPGIAGKDDRAAGGVVGQEKRADQPASSAWARGYLDSLSTIDSEIRAGAAGEEGAALQAPPPVSPEAALQRAVQSVAAAEGIAPTPPNYLKSLAGGYDYVFEAPGAIPVPSDGQVHAIPLWAETMDAAFSYVTVPSAIEYVFFSATGKNTRDSPLLAGNASIFSGGDFLGRTRFSTLSPGETFEVSLGVDEEVKVTHHVEEAQEDKGLLGGKRQTTVTVEMKLKSFKKKPIGVVVRDRIPFSDQTDLTVEKLPPVDPDPEEIGDGRGKEGRGVVRWKVKLAPGVERVVKFGYTMLRPKDTFLTYRERNDMRGAP